MYANAINGYYAKFYGLSVSRGPLEVFTYLVMTAVSYFATFLYPSVNHLTVGMPFVS